MIKTFKQFFEALTSTDMKNAIDLNIEKGDAQQPTQNNAQQQQPQNMQKPANLKVTDIQGRINQLLAQKKLVSQELINLQDAQRDLMPNNLNDPDNANKVKIFTKDQQEKTKIQQDKLRLLDQEIQNLQAEIGRNKEKYL